MVKIKIVKIKIGQNQKCSKLKVAKIESGDKWSKLKEVKIKK